MTDITTLQCPACTHTKFQGVNDRNDEVWVQCRGCDVRFTLDELQEQGEEPLESLDELK